MSYTELNPHAYISTTNGSGVSIYVSEYGTCPNNSFSTHYESLRSLAGDVAGVDDHAIMVNAIALATAPQANVFCNDGKTLPTASYDVENYSFHWDTVRTYTSHDADFDDHIYANNVAVFKSAGNESNTTSGIAGNVTDPGHAYNVITVGNYDPSSSDGIYYTSSYKDPLTGASKPEIIAPGSHIEYPGIYINENDTSGTSWAASHAAGFAADMMSKWSGFKSWSHAVKSAMMISAERESGWIEDKVGAGLIKFGNLYDITYNRVVDAQPNSYLSTPKTYDFTIDPYKDVKMVVSWLNKGSATISMDVNLAVENLSTHQIWSSSSENNPFEMLNFSTGSQAATYRVTISREDNNDPSCTVNYTLFVMEQ